MKKTIQFLVILCGFLLITVDSNGQSLDVVNNNTNDFKVTYCTATVGVAGGATGSTANPCSTAPPCSVNIEFGLPPGGCNFNVPLVPCPVAGVAYNYSVSSFATGCAVPTINFSITIDTAGNVVITLG